MESEGSGRSTVLLESACAGFPVKLAVVSVGAMSMSRLLPESSDMISLSCTHDYTDIAAKARIARCSK